MRLAGLTMAWRNLWRRRRRTWLTIGAMVFSNTLLVFAISLQLGSYDMMINNTLQAWSGHVQLQHPRYLDDPRMRYAISDISGLAERLRQQLGLDTLSARASGFALVSSAERSYGIQVIGVDPRHEPLVSTLPGLIEKGRYLGSEGAAEIVIGSVLARNLKVAPGDELTFLGSGFDDSFAAGIVTVAGIFESGNAVLDRSVAQVELEYFQQVFGMQGHGHSIVLRAPRVEDTGALIARLADMSLDPAQIVARDWDELQPGLRQAIQADLASNGFMYLVLVVLVAFSVLNTQLMSVLERTREFGTMMALGVKASRLARLVMFESALMTGVGLALGILCGFLLTWYLSYAGFSYPGMAEMAERFNLPERIYPSLTPLSMTAGPLIVALGSLLAAIYPAARLFRLLPVEAMRAV